MIMVKRRYNRKSYSKLKHFSVTISLQLHTAPRPARVCSDLLQFSLLLKLAHTINPCRTPGKDMGTLALLPALPLSPFH